MTKKHLPNSKIKVIFKSPSRLSSVFNFKGTLPSYLVSGVVYKYTCIGKTKRHTQNSGAILSNLISGNPPDNTTLLIHFF